jgi:uncharacterized protein (TIRG00374 family)
MHRPGERDLQDAADGAAEADLGRPLEAAEDEQPAGGDTHEKQHPAPESAPEAPAGDGEPAFFTQPKRLIQTVVFVTLIVAAIYILLPNLVGLDDTIARLGEAEAIWVAIAVGFMVLSFAAYVSLFRGVIGERVLHLEWREAYQITLAGLAATRLFSAGGAGGIVLTYWALRKAGMSRGESATRMIAFLILLYGAYLIALVVFGILLRTGALPGGAPVALTIIPAAVAFGIIIAVLLMALIPGDLQRRLSRFRRGGLLGRLTHRLATVPETLARGTRTALEFLRSPRQGAPALVGAIGWWAANIAILWASFEAFGLSVPVAVLIQGFFVGMAANFFPFAPAGVGAVDAGLIGTFVLFGLPGSTVLVAVLTYRLIAFWVPIPPGIVAFLQLRKTVARWESERDGSPVSGEPAESLPGPITAS